MYGFFLVLAIILLVIIIIWANKSDKKSIKDLKSLTAAVLMLTLFILFMMGMNLIINTDGSDDDIASSNMTVADGYTIDSFDIVLDVDNNQKVNVKEKIGINFYESGHHGIYMFIPSWLKYTNKYKEVNSKKAIIDNINVTEKYSWNYQDGKVKIVIGESDVTLPVGLHEYNVTYDYNLGSDIYKGYDEFIFHAYGDFWGTQINNATMKIIMPRKVDGDIKFFADKYRKDDITEHINYNIDGNIITATVADDYILDGALTIDIVLPDGYFYVSESTYGTVSLILCVFCISLAFIAFVIWVNKGRDGTSVSGGEFYPTNGYDAAEIGYIYKGETGKKLAISLIFSLAIKGVIKINKEKKNIIISKTTFDTVDEAIDRKIKVVKINEFANIDKKSPINAAIKSYFPGKTKEFIIESNFDDTLKDLKYLIDHGFLKIESDTINDYSKDALDDILKNITEEKEKLFSTLSDNERIVYNQIFSSDNNCVDLKKHKTFYKVFDVIGKNVVDKFESSIYDISAYKYMVVCSILCLVCTLAFGSAYFDFEDLNPTFNVMYFFAFASIFIIAIFTFIMGRKSTYGEELVASIKQFKRQIELISDKELDSILEDNKYYYYDMIPYTYIFGISKAWSKKFKNIPGPKYDIGNLDYYDSNLIYNAILNSIYDPSSVGGSSGSSSFGCSSCGGGCSSCGGGGSW